MSDDRSEALGGNLAAVRERVETAASASGRPGSDVTLVVVTKTWPESDLRILHALGVRDFGENRHQEAAEKAAGLTDLDVKWHFIGQVQSNKAHRIAEYAGAVHSVDSERVARRLAIGAQRADRNLDCFIQVSLDATGNGAGRGGALPGSIAEIAAVLASSGTLRLAGVMGVAPVGEDAAAAYARLLAVSRELGVHHPGATAVSAGMSDDFEAAVRAGATHVRVGSAVLGRRPSLR